MHSALQAALNLISQCCLASSTCQQQFFPLQQDIANTPGNSTEDLVSAQLCRSGLVMCREGDLVSWQLDF